MYFSQEIAEGRQKISLYSFAFIFERSYLDFLLNLVLEYVELYCSWGHFREKHCKGHLY